MTTKHPILLVDDEPEILSSLRGLLRREFELHTAEGGAEALDLLRRHPVHVIVTDQRMPGMTGAEFLRQARADHPDAVRIMFTGYADLRAVIDAVNHGGIYRYVTKPWDPDDFAALLHQACDHYDRTAGQHHLLRDLRDHAANCQTLLGGRPDAPAVEAVRAGGELLERADRALTPEAPLSHPNG